MILSSAALSSSGPPVPRSGPPSGNGSATSSTFRSFFEESISPPAKGSAQPGAAPSSAATSGTPVTTSATTTPQGGGSNQALSSNAGDQAQNASTTSADANQSQSNLLLEMLGLASGQTTGSGVTNANPDETQTGTVEDPTASVTAATMLLPGALNAMNSAQPVDSGSQTTLAKKPGAGSSIPQQIVSSPASSVVSAAANEWINSNWQPTTVDLKSSNGVAVSTGPSVTSPTSSSQLTAQLQALRSQGGESAATTHPAFALTIRTEAGSSAAVTEPEPAQNPDAGQPISNVPPSLAQPALDVNSNAGINPTQISPLANSNSSTTAISATDQSKTSDPTDSLYESSSINSPVLGSLKASLDGSASDSKSGSDQTDDKQAFGAFIDTSAALGPSTPAGTFTAPAARLMTEYTTTEQTSTAHSTTPVTDIRLQVDGASNQQVSVRLVQQADGLRVTVHSNDPALSQTLQDHVPELTNRLEQHHYQTEVLLPDRGEAAHFSPANAGSNTQQDGSGRHQGSSGQQGNPQNRQNQQQKEQQSWDEDSFSDLLA